MVTLMRTNRQENKAAWANSGAEGERLYGAGGLCISAERPFHFGWRGAMLL